MKHLPTQHNGDEPSLLNKSSDFLQFRKHTTKDIVTFQMANKDNKHEKWTTTKPKTIEK